MCRLSFRLPLRRLLCATAVLLLTACYDSSFGEAPDTVSPPAANLSLGELQRLFTGKAATITGNLIVAGRVTTSDRSGNFYRSLIIESDGAALEILAGLYGLHNDYPVGSLLTLRLEGLAIDRRFGILQAGRPAAGSGEPDYIGSQAALDRCLIRAAGTPEPVEPHCCTIGSLSLSDCGRLVVIEGLHYAPDGLEERCWAGYHRFADADGAAICTYVSDYADFADAEVPFGSCSLIGILQHDTAAGGRYLLKLRDATDHRP